MPVKEMLPPLCAEKMTAVPLVHEVIEPFPLSVQVYVTPVTGLTTEA